jgi:hypothetical protein
MVRRGGSEEARHRQADERTNENEQTSGFLPAFNSGARLRNALSLRLTSCPAFLLCFFPVLLILRIRRECDARRGVECWGSTCGDFCRGNSAPMQPKQIRENLKFHGRRGLINQQGDLPLSSVLILQHRQAILYFTICRRACSTARGTRIKVSSKCRYRHKLYNLCGVPVPLNGPHHPCQVRRVEYVSRNAKCVTMMPCC